MEWDGAEWKEMPKVELPYLIAKAAREFGWTLSHILDMTPVELRAMLDQVPRLNLEAATYAALAFNDPKQIGDGLQEIHDKNLSPREKWEKGIARLREAMKK